MSISKWLKKHFDHIFEKFMIGCLGVQNFVFQLEGKYSFRKHTTRVRYLFSVTEIKKFFRCVMPGECIFWGLEKMWHGFYIFTVNNDTCNIFCRFWKSKQNSGTTKNIFEWQQVFSCVCVVAVFFSYKQREKQTIKFLQDTSGAENDVSLEIAIFHIRSRFKKIVNSRYFVIISELNGA